MNDFQYIKIYKLRTQMSCLSVPDVSYSALFVPTTSTRSYQLITAKTEDFSFYRSAYDSRFFWLGKRRPSLEQY
jgi:hypothetical protein